MVRAYIPAEYRQRLDDYCKRTKQSIGEAICTFLDTYADDSGEDE